MSVPFESPRRVLARHGFAPKRSYSQNFLVSPRAIEGITRACALGPGDHVLELGAGCGTLTFALSATGAKVYALERDPDMLSVLAAERGTRDIEIVPGDAQEVDLATFVDLAPGRIVVAGNLPYAITGAIFRNLVEQHALVARAVLMVQREVRDRLVAEPGTAEYGALTVFATQVFRVETILHLPRTAFHPPPKVTSSVVRLTPEPSPRAPLGGTFERVVRAAFQNRRKTLRNALRTLGDAAQAEGALARAGIDGTRRGETLSVEEFGLVARAYSDTSGATRQA